MSAKDTIENMRALASSRGGSCLSETYVDQRTPLLWRCKEGHTWQAAPSQVKGSRNKAGTWCPVCGQRLATNKRMATVADMEQLATSRGGTFASTEYRGSQVKHAWRCRRYPEHSEFQMWPCSVRQGQWCPHCAGNARPTLDDLSALAREHHPLARCLSNSYRNSTEPLTWSCGSKEHPSFTRSYRSVRYDGGWCPLCKKERARPKKYDRELLCAFAQRLGGCLVTPEPYRSTKQLLRWRCADGHEFTRSLDSILTSRSFCAECRKRAGFREQYIRALFAHLFGVPFERTRGLDWLKNDRGNKMEIDGFNAELALAFEHNGQQHYELDGYFATRHEQVVVRQRDDAVKVRLCQEHRITLVVVPFHVPIADIEQFVRGTLANHGVVPGSDEQFEPGLFSPSKLETLQRYAKRLGGQLLSIRYLGSAGKLLWRCREASHPPFQSTPSAVISGGRWCRRCANQKRSDSYRVSLDVAAAWAAAAGGKLLADEGRSGERVDRFALSESVEVRCNACSRQHRRTLRQIKDGRLCLCRTKRLRYDHPLIMAKLEARSWALAGPVRSLRGRDLITIRCTICNSEWTTKLTNVANEATGCPKCRRNARIDSTKAHALATKLDFELVSKDVKGGDFALEWRCLKCGSVLMQSYRKMRGVRRCPGCVKAAALERLRTS